MIGAFLLKNFQHEKNHHSLHQKLGDLCEKYIDDLGSEKAYREFIRAVETEVVLFTFKSADENMLQTAKLMGMSRTSPYSVCLRLGVHTPKKHQKQR